VGARALTYHDVVAAGTGTPAGFPNPAPATYKLDRRDFERRLAAVAAVTVAPRHSGRPGATRCRRSEPPRVLLTFDDGGASASSCIGDLLERAR
jgi:peptidoglycan/xylan/chitin deacetylase (PgdA/CDA1 family)